MEGEDSASSSDYDEMMDNFHNYSVKPAACPQSSKNEEDTPIVNGASEESPSKNGAAITSTPTHSESSQSDKPNIKLVLKKSNMITAKTSGNHIVLVRLVSNSNPATVDSPEAVVEEVAADEAAVKAPSENSALIENTKSVPPRSKELDHLQKAVSDSKVLSEYVADGNWADNVSKTRKARKVEQRTLQVSLKRTRSKSCAKSGRTTPAYDEESLMEKWPSSEKLSKRMNMRSQNSEFAQKHMKFLNRVCQEGSEMTDNSDAEAESTLNISDQQEHDLEQDWKPPVKDGTDSFCWKCTKSGDLMPCSKCPKAFHEHCVRRVHVNDLNSSWQCHECIALEKAAMKPDKERMSQEYLNQLLKLAIKRLMENKEFSLFVDSEFLKDESNKKYVVYPVTLKSLDEKVDQQVFQTTEEFLMDVKWIPHNAAIIYGGIHKISSTARALLKSFRRETHEMEACTECYYNANTNKQCWFIQVCTKPHILLWAKLKGFPYWPAKGMKLHTPNVVNVRFFGDHDRALVQVKDCYLISEGDPNMKRITRNGMPECLNELKQHIANIEQKVGRFQYAPFKTLYDPLREHQQLESMLPTYSEYKKSLVASPKLALTYKIVKTGDNNLSIVKKSDLTIEKSKKSPPQSTEASAAEAEDVATSYEVISKSNIGNDVNKVNTVIIKRKSDAVVPIEPKESTPKRKKVEAEGKECEKSDTVPPLVLLTPVGKNLTNNSVKNSNNIVAGTSTSTADIETIVKSKQGVTITKISKEEFENKTKEKPTQGEVEKLAPKPTEPLLLDHPRDLIPFPEIKEEPLESSRDEGRSDEPKIKEENLSDVEEQAQGSKAGEDVLDGGRNRISVTDISKLITQPSKTLVPRCLPLGAKKSNQRARKTFCNAANHNQAVNDPPSRGSMVYIPISGPSPFNQSKHIPIPPLTSASKAVTQQSTASSATTASMVQTQVVLTTTNGRSPLLLTSSSNGPISSTSTHPTPADPPPPPSSAPPSQPPPTVVTEHHMLSGILTPSLAAAITDTIVRAPPKLVPRPTGALRSNGDTVYNTEAGTVSKALMENSHKMTDFFRSVIEDTLSDMAGSGVLEAKVQLLELEIEQLKHAHRKEIADLKHNTDLMLCEMRNSIEKEKARIITDTRKQCEVERVKLIDEIKKKQWCANCVREAQFYCCWNTSYCSYMCQQKHWGRHMSVCEQLTKSSKPADAGSSKPIAKPPITDTQPQTRLVAAPQVQVNQIHHRNKDQLIITATPYTPIQPKSKEPQMLHQTTSTTTFIRPSGTPLIGTLPIQYNIQLPMIAPRSTQPPYTLVQKDGRLELVSINDNSLGQ